MSCAKFFVILILFGCATAAPDNVNVIDTSNAFLTTMPTIVSVANVTDAPNAFLTTMDTFPSKAPAQNFTSNVKNGDLILEPYPLGQIQENDYNEVEMSSYLRNAFAKQVGLPNNPVGLLTSRIPCACQKGVCGCCTRMILALFRSKACINITYFPEDFAFDVKMLFNDRVLYENRLSGRNPRPICIRPPRFNFIEVCAVFHDIYFVGRNMHFCLTMEANFQGYPIFERSFNCMRIGDQGVKVVKPEDGGGITYRPSLDADVDQGGDEIEDYDENVIRQNNAAILR